MQKKNPEVLTKLSAVLMLDLPDFIRDFVLNLKNKLEVYIKRKFNNEEKVNKDVDEFEILKWLIRKISRDLKQVPKHQHKVVHAVLFRCFFTQLSEALDLELSKFMRADPDSPRRVKLSASTYKKHFGLDPDLKLQFERNLYINFYPEKLW